MLIDVKPVNGHRLSASEREFNRSINSWRAPVERALAHLRNRKMWATTGYRGLLSPFPAKPQVITDSKSTGHGHSSIE